MTERLYYTDSFLWDFQAMISGVREAGDKAALVLDRTAFYPTSGGQPFDTGRLKSENGQEIRVAEVLEDEHGDILHLTDPAQAAKFAPGAGVRGTIDSARRLDHMRQHSGQHVLSGAFLRLFQMPTVSFHLGADSCTIDLSAGAVGQEQARQAEELANAIVMDDRPVEIRFATVEEARAQGVRRIPAEARERLRLIDMHEFDLNACGGTHVRSTGQIGPILLRKLEKVKQGCRVEFVCGERAVRAARLDYDALAEAAALYSSQLREAPQKIRMSMEEIKAGQKEKKKLLQELAEFHAARLLAGATETGGVRLVIHDFADGDLEFIRLVGQSMMRMGRAMIALLTACGAPQPAAVFAQSPGGRRDMGALMKQVMTNAGGRGGGTRDLAQGGAPDGSKLQAAVEKIVESWQLGVGSIL